MTQYCPTLDTSLGLRGWASSGVSDVARQVAQSFGDSLEHFLEPRLMFLLPEVENLPVDSDDDQIPVNSDTVRAATQFVYSLPRFCPMPEVSVDPDGAVSFDCIGASDKMVSVRRKPTN